MPMIVGVDGKSSSPGNPGGPTAPHQQDLRQQGPAVAVAIPVVAPVANMNAAMAVKPPAFTNQWSSGMCNCCALGCGTCCRACFCPCMVVGEISDYLAPVEAGLIGGEMKQYACCIYCAMDWAGLCIGVPPLGWLMHADFRRAIRNRYAIKGACDDGCGDVGDYVDACCCVSCTLVQEMNELRIQGAGPNGINAPNLMVNGQRIQTTYVVPVVTSNNIY